MDTLLDIKQLSLSFNHADVIRNVSFSVQRGKIFSLVGESGSGKSLTALSIMRLIPRPGKINSGQIIFKGIDLLNLSENDMQHIRGRDISMIFQEPMTSLNPVLTVGKQIAEPLELHEGLTPSQAKEKAICLLERVGIPSPSTRFDDYPHQFSGGMRQRAMIAMALACSPALLLADEPTTALDITIQQQILLLLKELAHENNMAILLITHDLGVVAECADDVAVMYAGEIVELCPAKDFFLAPKHPYSQLLMECAPLVGNHTNRRLPSIPGAVPRPGQTPQGCVFHPRCPYSGPQCLFPQFLSSTDNKHAVSCCIYEKKLK